MLSEVLAHLAYKIANAEVRHFPFPHIFVENIFPDDFYTTLIDNLPTEKQYEGVEGKYKGRVFYDPTEMAFLGPLRTDTFTDLAKWPFRKHIANRFPDPYKEKTDLRLVLDSENYSIGPHTDAKWKVLSFLFYLPENRDLEALGTSIYLPKNQGFRCPGGPHYKHEDFVRAYTAPYIPNSLFGFFKTDYSFHGVEPITIPCRRDVLLWNLYGSE